MNKKSKKLAVLVSGGIDSVVLLNDSLKRGETVYPVYVENGNKWESAEQNHLKITLKKFKNRHLKPLIRLALPLEDSYKALWPMTGKKVPGAKSQDEAVYLPGKNILLIAKTAVYCSQNKIPEIAIGVLKTNPFPDASPVFFRRFESLLSKGLDFKIKIRVPFISKKKKDVMKLGKNLPLEFSFSCIHPKGNRHCGKCNKCAERKKAFKSVGRKDLTRYAIY